MTYLKEIFTERYWFRKNLRLFGYLKTKSRFIAFKKPHQENKVLFEAIHPFGKRPFLHLGEINTAQIAHFAADYSKSPILISLVPRHLADLGKSSKAKKTKMIYPINEELQKKAINDYHRVIKYCLREGTKRNNNNILTQEKLIVSVHGMKNSILTDIDLGTGNGKKCDYSLAIWFKSEMEKSLARMGLNINISVDQLFSNRWGNLRLNKKLHLGRKLKYLQLEISQKLRIENSDKISLALAEVAGKFPFYENNREEIIRDQYEDTLYYVYQVDDQNASSHPNIYLSYKQRKVLKKAVKEKLVLDMFDGIEFVVRNAKREQLGMHAVGLSQSFIKHYRVPVGKRLNLISIHEKN